MGAIPKRLRYEILRRDGHRCRYCGRTASEVALTVDHVVPDVLGGLTVPDNLVAACADCNAGKSSGSPDAPMVADVQRAHFEWREFMRQARLAQAVGYDEQIAEFERHWDSWRRNGSRLPKPPVWQAVVAGYLDSGLEVGDLVDLIGVAMRKQDCDDEWRYFCGCCRNRLEELHAMAAEMRAGTRRIGVDQQYLVMSGPTELFVIRASAEDITIAFPRGGSVSISPPFEDDTEPGLVSLQADGLASVEILTTARVSVLGTDPDAVKWADLYDNRRGSIVEELPAVMARRFDDDEPIEREDDGS